MITIIVVGILLFVTALAVGGILGMEECQDGCSTANYVTVKNSRGRVVKTMTQAAYAKQHQADLAARSSPQPERPAYHPEPLRTFDRPRPERVDTPRDAPVMQPVMREPGGMWVSAKNWLEKVLR